MEKTLLKKLEMRSSKKNSQKLKLGCCAIVFLFTLNFTACEEQNPKKNGEIVETMNSGKLDVLCDDAVYSLMQKPISWYLETYNQVTLTVKPASCNEIMKNLLANQVRVCIISRDYSPREDSLMKVYKVEKHVRMPIADDAIVFYVKTGNMLDSLTDKQLFDVFTRNEARLSKMNPSLAGKEPIFAISGSVNSSLFYNFKNLVAKGSKIVCPMKMLSTPDSVVDFVLNTPNAIGIGYLSHVANNGKVRLIPIGFHDSSGKYFDAKPVHQSYLVQGLMPYKVTHYVYVLEDRKNLPFWFATYLGKERRVMEYLRDSGIVPSFAKFQLIPE
ncbi:MAG: substrate-binding domain-containing protein [Candidatus Kapabacteria bacterium]|nr:substrate-binding domain-containing protein [Candidatus Kapabacteria bacterium]